MGKHLESYHIFSLSYLLFQHYIFPGGESEESQIKKTILPHLNTWKFDIFPHFYLFFFHSHWNLKIPSPPLSLILSNGIKIFAFAKSNFVEYLLLLYVTTKRMLSRSFHPGKCSQWNFENVCATLMWFHATTISVKLNAFCTPFCQLLFPMAPQAPLPGIFLGKGVKRQWNVMEAPGEWNDLNIILRCVLILKETISAC